MTTDNRANEPTEAMIEAAAKALAGGERLFREYPNNDLDRDRYRKDARAALVAAQGAAPQAESEPLREALHRAREHFTAIAASGEIRVWEDTGEKLGIDHQARGWAKRGERICFDALAAPVLPSSTVGEDKLAEVLCREMDGETYEGEPCAACKSQAHAVAEWLAGKEKDDEWFCA